MSTCWPRTASSKPICSQASGCPVPSEPRSRKSANGWAGNCCSKSPASPTLTRFSAGIGSWSPPSSTAPDSVGGPAGRGSPRRSSVWWFGWRERIPAGGYDRIVGALAHLGHTVSDQTVGNILRRQGIAPAPERKRTTTWSQFIGSHMAVLAGTDFFTVELLTWRGLVTYYVLFFLHLETRRVTIAGITRHPTEEWMTQMARNAVDEESGYLRRHRYVLHDRDTKFCADFRKTPATGGVKCLRNVRRSF